MTETHDCNPLLSAFLVNFMFYIQKIMNLRLYHVNEINSCFLSPRTAAYAQCGATITAPYKYCSSSKFIITYTVSHVIFNVQCVHLLFFIKDEPQVADSSVSVVAVNEAGKVRVSWSRPPLGTGQVITGYSVQYRRRGTTFYGTRSVSGSSTTYTITNLTLGTVYEVRVASIGPLGLSGYCCGSGKLVTTYNSEWAVQVASDIFVHFGTIHFELALHALMSLCTKHVYVIETFHLNMV